MNILINKLYYYYIMVYFQESSPNAIGTIIVKITVIKIKKLSFVVLLFSILSNNSFINPIDILIISAIINITPFNLHIITPVSTPKNQ